PRRRPTRFGLARRHAQLPLQRRRAAGHADGSADGPAEGRDHRPRRRGRAPGRLPRHPGALQPQGRQRPGLHGEPDDADRHRVALLLAIVALFLFFFWGAVSDNPIVSARDAFWDTVRSKAWLIGLLMLEAIRQLHYVFSERDAGYHRFWKERIFGGVDRRFSG